MKYPDYWNIKGKKQVTVPVKRYLLCQAELYGTKVIQMSDNLSNLKSYGKKYLRSDLFDEGDLFIEDTKTGKTWYLQEHALTGRGDLWKEEIKSW